MPREGLASGSQDDQVEGKLPTRIQLEHAPGNGRFYRVNLNRAFKLTGDIELRLNPRLLQLSTCHF